MLENIVLMFLSLSKDVCHMYERHAVVCVCVGHYDQNFYKAQRGFYVLFPVFSVSAIWSESYYDHSTHQNPSQGGIVHSDTTNIIINKIEFCQLEHFLHCPIIHTQQFIFILLFSFQLMVVECPAQYNQQHFVDVNLIWQLALAI